MDCVGCEKCRLWGKLQVLGLGTALKILFSVDGQNHQDQSVSSPSLDSYIFRFPITSHQQLSNFSFLIVQVSMKQLMAFIILNFLSNFSKWPCSCSCKEMK